MYRPDAGLPSAQHGSLAEHPLGLARLALDILAFLGVEDGLAAHFPDLQGWHGGASGSVMISVEPIAEMSPEPAVAGFEDSLYHFALQSMQTY